jgi:hypothetical protein
MERTMTSKILSSIMAGALLAGVLATPAMAGDWVPGPYGPYYQRGGSIGPGAAAALGVLGGVAVGAAIAGGAAPAPVVVAPPPPAPVYVPRRVVVEDEEVCRVERTREWVPGFGWEIHRRRVCE